VRQPARCGTVSGYQKHRRDGTLICEPCGQARREYQRAYEVRVRSGYRLSIEEALGQLGLPPDRVAGGGR